LPRRPAASEIVAIASAERIGAPLWNAIARL
jgi:hypothetical protein